MCLKKLIGIALVVAASMPWLAIAQPGRDPFVFVAAAAVGLDRKGWLHQRNAREWEIRMVDGEVETTFDRSRIAEAEMTQWRNTLALAPDDVRQRT